MINRWSAKKPDNHKVPPADDLAQRVHSGRLIGLERRLVLHGGGNTSVKTTHTDILGQQIPVIYVKASGADMATAGPEGYVGLRLEYLQRLSVLQAMSDQQMINEIRTQMLDYRCPNPSLETLMHVFIPFKYIDHTHPDAILTLTNQTNAQTHIRNALGQVRPEAVKNNDVVILDYITPGFKLAKAVSEVFSDNPGCRAIVLMYHGLITCGESARESYDLTIELVSRAERYIESARKSQIVVTPVTTVSVASQRYRAIAPIIRGMLASKTEDSCQRVILNHLATDETLAFVESERGREIALTPPITTDYLIRTKAFPLWLESPDFDKIAGQLADALSRYRQQYDAYIGRHRMQDGLSAFDSQPRVIFIPGLGVICAGRDARAARIAADITAQSVAVKGAIAAMGAYQAIEESDLFTMEYRDYQHAKVSTTSELPLCHHVALVTGAAGAIGSAICRGLLEQGAHVAVADLSGEALNSLVGQLEALYGNDRVLGVPMDVTDADSVRGAFAEAVGAWGGVDLLVPNAGIAMVSTLENMSLEAFRKVQRVNVDGTLNVLSEAARLFRVQGSGGDIVMVSTKNVFAPGAGFGAYSASKAAAHQLARIASLELASIDVRVNMVAPDAVFSDGARKSGLWAEIGPDRMKARGLDEKGLEDYYVSRNLLKASIKASHVARAVLFFATRQTPTTGATIPVDGGLPDATPR
ncbi:bifunctional aldolase/short-chain dehydrogenase [Candidatus Magnetobacterium casense]|uniref:Bifunctional aldolase/short-chain dehydrogenase n=1 Tax=Candidatus Magnetobacterium casense TaxID=1455061 RepID=A0ABS6RWZ5_9BACT|nr:bifunctional aldolase/short-chain dehydrogenase [Candidatus Magnetobacterium casensis]MBV6340778.1 bifunctional aldolase/short-chain dehydrogenase [Candidatus Magnetobacterium casensis]